MLEGTRRTLTAGTSGAASPFRPALAFGGYVVAFFAGQVVATFIVLGDADGEDLPIPLLFAAALAGWLAFTAMLWMLSTREGTGDVVADYAVGVSWVDLAAVPIGVATQLLAVPLLYWPLRSIWPGTFSEDEVTEYAEDLVNRASGAEIVLLVVMVVVVAPLVEELVYRGLLQRSLATIVRPPLAVLFAATFFALVHFRPVEYPGLLLVGIVLGACVAATGRLGMAIAAHVAFNATGLIIAAA